MAGDVPGEDEKREDPDVKPTVGFTLPRLSIQGYILAVNRLRGVALFSGCLRFSLQASDETS